VETVLEESCANCGSERRADGGFCLFCGDPLVRPEAQTANRAPFAPPSVSVQPEYASLWRRFWAGVLDLALEAVGALLLTLALDFVLRHLGRGLGIDPWDSKVFTGMAYILILAIGSWLYCAFAESSSWRATVGKRLLGLQVITAEGGRTSFGQATVRHFMKFLSLFCATIGFFMPLWTKRRQSLHDMPCDVLVIRVPKSAFSFRKT
jgi:uncharacterized RDD family membrane protein YckC